jgi:hypothetical protein
VYDLSLLSARGGFGSRARNKSHLMEARRLVRFRSMVPRAGQLLDISCGAGQRASGGSDSRVLWNAPYRRSSHSLGDIRIATHFSLFFYALPARPVFVRAGCKALDDRGRHPVHSLGSIHRPGGLRQLPRCIHVNDSNCQISGLPTIYELASFWADLHLFGSRPA